MNRNESLRGYQRPPQRSSRTTRHTIGSCGLGLSKYGSAIQLELQNRPDFLQKVPRWFVT